MSFWDDHQITVDPENFRANGHYLGVQNIYPYVEVTLFVKSLQTPWLDILSEDDAFGITCEHINGTLVSRDLLDSALELEFLSVRCGLNLNTRILDIGAGYGRLAHRLTTAFPSSYVYCTDAIEVSHQICSKYLSFRGISRAEVLRQSELASLQDIYLAINIHSWPECTREAIDEWLDLLVTKQVRRLLVIPHPWFSEFFCMNDGLSFLPNIETRGYRLAQHWRPLESIPRDYYLFELGQLLV
jgi:putative sugar O-methyltransferase